MRLRRCSAGLPDVRCQASYDVVMSGFQSSFLRALVVDSSWHIRFVVKTYVANVVGSDSHIKGNDP